MTNLEESVEWYTETLFEKFGTSEEVLKYLNNEIDKMILDEFYFDEPTFTFDFLNKVRRHISNKAKFQ